MPRYILLYTKISIQSYCSKNYILKQPNTIGNIFTSSKCNCVYYFLIDVYVLDLNEEESLPAQRNTVVTFSSGDIKEEITKLHVLSADTNKKDSPSTSSFSNLIAKLDDYCDQVESFISDHKVIQYCFYVITCLA